VGVEDSVGQAKLTRVSTSIPPPPHEPEMGSHTDKTHAPHVDAPHVDESVAQGITAATSTPTLSVIIPKNMASWHWYLAGQGLVPNCPVKCAFTYDETTLSTAAVRHPWGSSAPVTVMCAGGDWRVHLTLSHATLVPLEGDRIAT
jgi:hypothetical protein